MADEIDLAEAYAVVFATPAGIIVLEDLLQFSGFLTTTPMGASPDVMIEHNARRRFFGRLYDILTQSQDGREALAVVLNPVATQE